MADSIRRDDEERPELPPTPNYPVQSYYRCPPPSRLWMYYNGETWVGEPVKLPWYKVPMPLASGRAPYGAGVLMLVIIAIAITLFVILK